MLGDRGRFDEGTSACGRRAAGRPDAPAHARRGRRPGAPAAARARRCAGWSRPPTAARLPLPDPLGTAGHRQDHAGLPRGTSTGPALRRAVRGHRRGQGRARGHRRARDARSAARARDRAVRRRDPPLLQDPAGRAAARRSRTAGSPSIAATTENPSFSVIAPLLSRSRRCSRCGRSTTTTSAPCCDRAVADPRGLGGAVELCDEARATTCCGSPAATPAGR